MTSTEFDEFRIHTITVATFAGNGGNGPLHDTPVTYSPTTGDGVLVDDTRKLIRGADGREVVSESTIFDPDVTHAATYTVGSLVTLPDGRLATSLQVKVRDGAGVIPSYVEVALT